MKHKMNGCHSRAFTLIEMLVVIAVIGILAALLFPAAASIKKTATLKRAKTELEQLETAIDSYKQKLNFYPPDNQLTPPKPAENPLYFELLGTVENTTTAQYETLDGSGKIPVAQVKTVFGREAFSNFGARKGSEEGLVAENFLKGTLKPTQIGELAPGIKVLAGSPSWPNGPWQPVPTVYGLNPWRYVSSNPTNNTKSYDLWIDLVIGGKTYRVSNWRKDPEIVTVP